VSAAALPARGALRAAWPWLAAAGGAVLLWWLLDARLTRDLLDWLPYLASGFAMNVLISVLAMTLGTLGGIVLGAMELSTARVVRAPAVAYVQVFRNAPHLVLIFATTYIFPFEIVVAGNYLPFPDWLKAVLGLAIPAAAYVAEIARGAIQSVPTTQWDAAKGIGLSRRALPPWMNLTASITMSTALASLVGVHELLHAATDASTAVRRDDFTVAIYLTVLLAFFLFCYPISRLTRRLERRFARR
jgi:polar amino acid transport system permease protein